MSRESMYREALGRASLAVRERQRVLQAVPRTVPCSHWFIVVKHACGPSTRVCQDCGYEEAA